MNGGITYKDLNVLKQKARNCDDALAWIAGRIDCESLLTLQDILRRGVTLRADTAPAVVAGDGSIGGEEQAASASTTDARQLS